MTLDVIDILTTRLQAFGLSLRGGFHRDAPSGTETVFLVGNLGGRFWPHFEAAGITGDHALDRWTEEMIAPIAREVEATPLFPFSDPPLPFLTWAQQAEGLHASPLGLLIHPDYGLWHAYRAALVFRDKIALPALRRDTSPCDHCADKPCLSTCPMDAFKPGSYDVSACRGFVNATEGAQCFSQGCKARQACPVGREHAYSATQQHFHMKAFA